MDILMTAFPMSVAPKNVQNGIRKWPQVMPAKSNNGFGMDAHARIPKNPTLLTRVSIFSFILSTRVIVSGFCCFLCSSSSSTRSSTSSGSNRDSLAARDKK
uniref:Uncharacterized protein n=1 Tax=Cacopsylla melanoneura TaxID=428564 RepID=A0A8D8YDS0_9HEMI